MPRRLTDIALEMQAHQAALAQADIHNLLRQERDLRDKSKRPHSGDLLQRMDMIATQIHQGWWLEEQIVGWLVANVPADLLALASLEANIDVQDYPPA